MHPNNFINVVITGLLKAREWSSFAEEVNSIYQEHNNKTKIRGKDNEHRGTLQARGERSNWNRKETILLY